MLTYVQAMLTWFISRLRRSSVLRYHLEFIEFFSIGLWFQVERRNKNIRCLHCTLRRAMKSEVNSLVSW